MNFLIKSLAYAVFTSVIILLLLEIGLRLTGAGLTPNERAFGVFWTEAGICLENDHLWRHNVNDQVCSVTPEYHVCCPTNSLGMIGGEFTDTAEFRIAVIGDSFIHGAGADCDSTMPVLLDTLLSRRGINADVWNAGVSGSDVFYMGEILEKLILPQNPTGVVLNLNNSDVDEVIARGGLKRFLPNGETCYRKPVVNLHLYRNVHTYRIYCHYLRKINYELVGRQDRDSLINEAILKICDQLSAIKDICDSAAIDFTVLLQPNPQDLQFEEWGDETDLSRIGDCLKGLFVDTIDLTSSMIDYRDSVSAQVFREYFWPEDHHFNNRGYALFSRLTCERLISDRPDFFY